MSDRVKLNRHQRRRADALVRHGRDPQDADGEAANSAEEEVGRIRLIRKRKLAWMLGVNPWTIDEWRRRGRIPEPIRLSPQVVAWRLRDIERWLAEREAAEG